VKTTSGTYLDKIVHIYPDHQSRSKEPRWASTT